MPANKKTFHAFISNILASARQHWQAANKLTNSYEAAHAFAANYYAQAAKPLTSKIESQLINLIMRKFGLSEETASLISHDTWPHTSPT